MNNSADNERLLADVLAEESDPGFRELLLGQTLHLVRCQRRFRKIRRAASAMAVIAGLLLLAWRFLPSLSNPPTAAAKLYTLVHTQPLPASAIVGTKPFPPSDVIASMGSVEVIATSAFAHNFRELNDDQLLDLMTPTPALLVRRGPHTAELVFVNPEDREAF